MKKAFSTWIALILVFVLLAGCAQQAAPAQSGDSPDSSANSPLEASSDEPSGVAETSDPIKVGAIFPMTGTASALGVESYHGVQLAAEIVNGVYDIDLMFAGEEGLPGLNGRKIEIVSADNQGVPATGQAEAERLITQSDVCSMVGAHVSGVATTISNVCEREGIPFIGSDVIANSLTESGHQYFFRTTPKNDQFIDAYFAFLEGMKEKGVEIKTIGLVYENSEWGSNMAIVEKRLAAEKGYEIVCDVSYSTTATDVTSEAQKVKQANPDVLMHSSYVSDAILFMNTYKAIDYTPKMILAVSGAFTAADFLNTLGKDALYVCASDPWSLELADTYPKVKQVNDLYKEKFGVDLNGVSARSFVAAMTLFEAINRAGSDDPELIKEALLTTDIPATDLIATWGVKFDPETHDNIYALCMMTQYIDYKYRTIYPFEAATVDFVYPMPSWAER